jgi:hypothetical protein
MKEGDEADRSDLAALVAAVEACPADGVLDLLEANFDVAALFAMWSVELAVADPDGYTTLANNYLLYYAPAAARWTMIPWGPDQGFAGEEGFGTALNGRLATMCAADEACKARWYEVHEAVVEVWEQSGLGDFVDSETARIEADCRADPRSDWGDYGCRDEQAAMRDWVAARPAALRAELR